MKEIIQFIILKILNQRVKFYVLWNRFYFWLYDVDYGKNMKVFNSIYLKKAKKSKLVIGDNFEFLSGGVNPLGRNIMGCFNLPFPTSQIIIGDDTGINSSCLKAKDSISIGNRVKIGANCVLIDTDSHNLDYLIRNSRTMVGQYTKDSITASSAPIIIEDDVLVGTQCIILKGVTIGARSIIAAGSIVTKSIPSDCIAGGNPAKIIRRLN